MPYTFLIFTHRKPNISPSTFKAHYETTHIPLIQSIAAPHFPKSHTRRYIQRSGDDDYPATVLIGAPADFDYDAIAELVFDDEEAYTTFLGMISEEDAARRIADDERLFLDRGRMRVVVLGECNVTLSNYPEPHSMETITRNEIVQAVYRRSSKKASGTDDIPNLV